MKKANLILILLLLIWIAATYANSLQGVFIFDDHSQILDNPHIKDWRNLSLIFTTGFGRLDITGANYYRPLLEFTYMIDYFLWANDKVGYHLTNIAFHAACAIILFLLLNHLFRDKKISFLTALIFGVHPVYTSAVTYISGRGDSMAILFILLSLFFYAKYIDSPKVDPGFLIVSCLSFLAALLTKEISLFFIFIIILYRFFPSKGSSSPNAGSKWIATYIAFSIALALYFFLRTNALRGVFTSQYNIVADSSISIRLLTMVKAFLNYLVLLAVPIGLHFERTIPLAESILEPGVLASLCIVVFGGYIFVKRRRKKDAIFYGILWYLINFIPISNIFIPLNAFIAENWIQIPAIGAFLALAAFTVKAYEAKTEKRASVMVRRSAIPVFVALVVFYSFLTINRNKEYHDPIVFYESALRHEPKAIKLYNNLGFELEKKKEIEKATSMYKKALEINPAHPTSLNNLANIYSSHGRHDDAIALYKKALNVDENNLLYLNNIGVAYIRKGDAKNALYYWKRSLEINPDQPVIKQYIEWNQ